MIPTESTDSGDDLHMSLSPEGSVYGSDDEGDFVMIDHLEELQI